LTCVKGLTRRASFVLLADLTRLEQVK